MDVPAPPAALLAGKYRLLERLGVGGMGAVWRAEHVHLHMPVAVKLMAREMVSSPTLRARFEREARAVAQLRSRHVVTIHDYGVEGEEPFIVMELLDGEDLAGRLRRAQRLAPAAAATIFGQIARALDRAHAAALVHRDLKPANVFLARQDDEEIVKVLDFGIAKVMHAPGADELTAEDEILGTPMYMSPEMIRGRGAVDLKADLWSLAVIGYRMLTGKVPFAGETGGDLAVRVCTEPALPPSSFDPSLGRAIDVFFERALAKDPSARFASAREMAASFEAALGFAAASPISSSPSLPEIVGAPLAAPRIEPPADTLAVQSTHLIAATGGEPAARRRGLAAIVAAGALAAGLAVAIGLSLRGGPPAVEAASSRPPVEPSATASAEAAPPPSASASAASEDRPAAPAPAAAASASASAVPAPAATAPPRGKLKPTKHRRVEIGL